MHRSYDGGSLRYTIYHVVFDLDAPPLPRATWFTLFFFLMIRRPPRSTLDRSSAASDVYKRQVYTGLFFFTAYIAYRERSGWRVGLWFLALITLGNLATLAYVLLASRRVTSLDGLMLSLIHISEPTRPY